MNLLNFLNQLLSHTQENTTMNTKAPTIPAHVHLSISKTLGELAFIDRSYQLKLWVSKQARLDEQHDFELMLHHGDLNSIILELLDANKMVLAKFSFSFSGQAAHHRITDAGGGVELPLITRSQVVGHRMLVNRNGLGANYRQWLHSNWSPATELPSRASESYKSKHAERISGGRQTGVFKVAPDARHELIITQVGNKGYAFARDTRQKLDHIFLHCENAPSNLRFQVGMHVSAILVQVPKGLQARNIKAA